MITVLQYILFIFSILLAIPVGYLVLLTLASLVAKRQTVTPSGRPTKHFSILIPAYNEERLLPGLLASLSHIDYPAHLFDIHVVADNCTDQTATVAQNGGAIAHIRTDRQNPGKGPALQWLLQKLFNSGVATDAFVILDADSLVSSNFLTVMAAHLENGERVIQAYYAVRDPSRSWTGGLRYAALSVLHYLRPQGRMVLGASVGLKGNGMVFCNDIFRQHEWSASVTEDIEMHMTLILDGERVTFAPDALVLGEMPDTLENSKSQHRRWEQGRLEGSRRYVPQLLRAAWVAVQKGKLKRSYIMLDAVMEHLIPPFTILLAVNILLLVFNLIALLLTAQTGNQQGSPFLQGMPGFNLLLSAGLLLGQFIYLFSGLFMVQAPREIYLSLLFAPIYMLWKTFQYVQVAFLRRQQGWVRTRRNEG